MDFIASPLFDRVIIKKAVPETKTKTGILLAETGSSLKNIGCVMAIGPGTKEVPSTVPVNSIVQFSAYAGSKITLGGVDYLIMNEEDIFCIL